MSAETPSTVETSYLGSNGKLLFKRAVWVLVILLIIFPVVVGAVNILILKRVGLDTNPTIMYIFAGIQIVFQIAAWLLILLPYGANNRVKAFKIMFFIVAGTEFLRSFSSFISAFGKSYTLYTQELFSPVIHTLSDVVGYLPVAAWIVFMVVVLCHPKTGKKLRKSSILMLISYALVIAYSAASLSLLQLPNQDNTVVGESILFFSFVLTILLVGSQIYFFRAMALSEMKRDCVDTVMEATI